MPRCLTLFSALCATVACVNGNAIDPGVTSNQNGVSNRAVEPSYFDTKEFKEAVPYLDFGGYCPKDKDGWLFWDTWIHPHVVPATDQVRFRTCYKRPIEVQEWKFTLNESCEYGRAFGVSSVWEEKDGGFDVEDKASDVFKLVEIETCVERPKDCWGEWINTPVWDYEWIVQVPMGVHQKYNKGECGLVFHEALKEACDPYEMTLFVCNPTWHGVELRFRYNLLCGRTRIQNAIRKASNNEVDLHCPYFVEVPVPR
jgi:hypothetical protein